MLSVQEFVATNSIFSGTSTATQKAFIDVALVDTLLPAQMLFQRGDIAHRIYFILDGQASICLFSSSGRQLSLNIVAKQNIIGEIATLDGGNRSATVIAITNFVVASISRQNLLKILANDAVFAYNIITRLCAEVRRISDKIVSLGLSNIEAGLAQILIEQATAISGTLSQEMILKIKQEEIANIAGVSRVTVNKHLNALKKKGLIEISRNKIYIKDAPKILNIIERNSEN